MCVSPRSTPCFLRADRRKRRGCFRPAGRNEGEGRPSAGSLMPRTAYQHTELPTSLGTGAGRAGVSKAVVGSGGCLRGEPRHRRRRGEYPRLSLILPGWDRQDSERRHAFRGTCFSQEFGESPRDPGKLSTNLRFGIPKKIGMIMYIIQVLCNKIE